MELALEVSELLRLLDALEDEEDEADSTSSEDGAERLDEAEESDEAGEVDCFSADTATAGGVECTGVAGRAGEATRAIVTGESALANGSGATKVGAMRGAGDGRGCRAVVDATAAPGKAGAASEEGVTSMMRTVVERVEGRGGGSKRSTAVAHPVAATDGCTAH